MNSGTTAALRGVWGSSAAEVYAVGDGGIILRYNGTTWLAEGSNTSQNLNAVWATAGDAWAVGEDVVLRRVSDSWSEVTLPDVTHWLAVWGHSGHVFVGGHWLEIYHYDGSNWLSKAHPVGGRFGLWGIGPNDVYAAGFMGTTHYAGSTWTVVSNTFDGLGVWGSGPADVYVVGWDFGGDQGYIEHFNGSWSPVSPPMALAPLRGVWGSASNNVYAVGDTGTVILYDGVDWTGVDTGTTVDLFAIWGTGPQDVFVVGAEGTILHYGPP